MGKSFAESVVFVLSANWVVGVEAAEAVEAAAAAGAVTVAAAEAGLAEDGVTP